MSAVQRKHVQLAAVRRKFGFRVVPCTCLLCSSAEECAVLTWVASGRWKQQQGWLAVTVPDVLLPLVVTVHVQS